MKITIITISFNQGDYLEECINSILNQNYTNVEYIVVDAGSTDGSRDIIARHSSRISKIIFEHDNGPVDGLNKGFKQGSGEILGYVNADDFLLPEALANVATLFKRWPAIDVLIGDGIMVNSEGVILRRLYSIPWNLKAYIYGHCTEPQQATFFRREIFEATGGFNVNNKTCWDGELLLDMSLCNARFKTTKKMLGAFRLHDNSITGSGRFVTQYGKDKARMAEKALGDSTTKWEVTALQKTYSLLRRIILRPRSVLFRGKLGCDKKV